MGEVAPEKKRRVFLSDADWRDWVPTNLGDVRCPRCTSR